MFNFQKEVILNSLDKAAVVTNGNGRIDKKVRFHDGGEYFAKYIVESKIYQTNPITGTNFELILHAPSNILGEHVQILIELGLDNDYSGDYGSALWYFRKPILVDVVLPNTSSDAAKVIYKAISKVIPEQYKFVEVSHTEGSGDVIVKGTDSHQKIRKVVISRYECEDHCSGNPGELVEVVNLSSKALETGNDYVTYTRNNEEFGTYNYVLHNLRLPTYANLRFTSPSAVEMPMQGVNYTQFSFAYCVPRVGFGGMSVAGQTNHSTTLHTFFVADNLVDDFKALFEEIGITDFVEIGREGSHNITILPDAYASSQDLKAATNIEKNVNSIKKNADAIKTNSDAIKANSDADAKVKAQVNKNKTVINSHHNNEAN